MFLKEILSENEPKYIKGDLLESIHETLLHAPFDIELGSSKVPFIIGFNPIENCDTILLYQDSEIKGFINYNPDANIGDIRPNEAVSKAIRAFSCFDSVRKNPAAAQSNLKFNLIMKRLGFCFEKELAGHLNVPILMRVMPSTFGHGAGYAIYFNLCIRNKRECFCEDFRCWDDFDRRDFTHMKTLTAELLEEIRYYGPLRTCSVPILQPPHSNFGSGVELKNITPDAIARWLGNGEIPESEFKKLITNLASLSLGMNQVWLCHHGLYTGRIDNELNLHNIDEAVDEYIQRHSDSLRRDEIDRIVHVTFNLCGLRLKSYKVYG